MTVDNPSGPLFKYLAGPARGWSLEPQPAVSVTIKGEIHVNPATLLLRGVDWMREHPLLSPCRCTHRAREARCLVSCHRELPRSNMRPALTSRVERWKHSASSPLRDRVFLEEILQPLCCHRLLPIFVYSAQRGACMREEGAHGVRAACNERMESGRRALTWLWLQARGSHGNAAPRTPELRERRWFRLRVRARRP